MTANRTSVPATVPAGLARHKQMLLVALAGAGAGVLVLSWLGSGSASAQGVATTFSPSVSITVPQTDSDGDGRNDFAGVSFDIEFDTAAGSYGGCTESATGTYVVQDNGMVMATPGTIPALVDRPVGVTSRCSYDVIFPDIAGHSYSDFNSVPLYLQSGAIDIIRATGRTASAAYSATRAPSGESFDPSVTVVAPLIDADNSGANDYLGTKIWITYLSDIAGCSGRIIEKHVIANNGSGSVAGSDARLNSYSANSSDSVRCVYALRVDEPSNEILKVHEGYGPNRRIPFKIDAAGNSITFPLVTSYNIESKVTIRVPWVDINGDSIHDSSGSKVRVHFRRASTSVEDCNSYGWGNSAWFSIGDDGVVSLSHLSNRGPLIDRLGGKTSRCAYDLTFKDNFSFTYPGIGPINRSELYVVPLYLQSGALTSLSATEGASASYSTVYIPSGNDNSFNPMVTVSVPQIDENDDGNNDLSGEKFWIGYWSYMDGCPSSVFEKYVVADDGTVSVDGTEITLDKRPNGSAVGSGCLYYVSPSITTIENFVWEYRSSRLMIDMNNHTVSIYYATLFLATVNLQTLAGGYGIGHYSGIAISVGVSAASGSPSGCTNSARGTYISGRNGNLNFDLVDYISSTAHRCSYKLDFGVSYNRLHLRPGFDTIVSGANATATAVYSYEYVPIGSSFSSSILVLAPQLDADANGENDYFGTFVRVRYDDSSSASRRKCPSGIEETYFVGKNGVASLVGPFARLQMYEINSQNRCVYGLSVAGYYNARDNLPLAGHSNTSEQRISSLATSGTISLVSVYSPVVSIMVPQINGVDNPSTAVDESLRNAFAGKSFKVSYTRVEGADTECPASAREYYAVRRSGYVELSSDAISLVDRIAGVPSRCSYVVSWSDVPGLVLPSDAPSTVSATDNELSVRYHTVFSPDVVVSVPSVGSGSFLDAVVTVTYERLVGSNSGCTGSANETRIVGVGGVMVLSGSAASLVDRIGGVEAACYYSIEFSDTSDVLKLQTDRSFMIGSASETTAVLYVSVFSPVVTITVPNVDADADGRKDFVDAVFTVSYARTPGSDAGCSSAVETFVAQSNGNVDPSSERVDLVDSIVGVSDVCSYFVAIVEEKVSLEPASSELVTISSGSSTVTASYETLLAPTITINVPNVSGDDGFAGTIFTVSYAKKVSVSGAGCTGSAAETYNIITGSVAKRLGSAARLVDYAGGASSACEYTVTISEQDDRLVRRGSSAIEVSTTRKTATVFYDAMFSPVVTIFVPQFSGANGNNDYMGNTFTVGYAKATGSNASCSATTSEIYKVSSTGKTEIPNNSASVSLVNYPAVSSASSACTYDVSFSSSNNSLVILSGASSSVSAASSAISASYIEKFAPDISILVPKFDDINGNNDYMGVAFTVSYAKASGADPSCSSSGTETYTVNSAGVVALQGTAASLVGRLPSASTALLCAYTVALTDTSQELEQQGNTAIQINASSDETEVQYSTMFLSLSQSPLEQIVDIEVPDVESEGENQYIGTDFVVKVKLSNSSILGQFAQNCSAYVVGESDGIPIIYTVDAQGDVAPSSGQALRLVDRPAGGDQKCKYEVTLPYLSEQNNLGLHTDSANKVILGNGGTTVSASYAAVDFINVSTDINFFGSTTGLVGKAVDIVISSTDSSNEICISNTLKYTIGENGFVESSPAAIALVERRPGAPTTCEYVVVATLPGKVAAQGGNTNELDNSSSELVANFSLGYVPRLAFRIPSLSGNEHIGTRFAASFTRYNDADENCTESLEIDFVVESDGDIEVNESQEYLVNIPWVKEEIGGESRYAAQNESCEYTVTFPEEEIGFLNQPERLFIKQQSGNSESESAIVVSPTVSASATYDTFFKPSVEFVIPALDMGALGSHPYAGAQIEVSYRYGRGQSNCSSRSTSKRRYTIERDGSAILVGDNIALIDLAVGSSASCSYTLKFKFFGLANNLVDQSVSNGTISAGARSTTVRYNASYNPSFSFEIDLQGNSSLDDFVDDFVYIYFELRSGPTSVCSGSELNASFATMEYYIEDNGVFETDDTMPLLVDGTFSYTGRCEYTAQFDLSETGLTLADTSVNINGSTGTRTITFTATSE